MPSAVNSKLHGTSRPGPSPNHSLAGRICIMTNGEKFLLIAYLVDAGEIDSDGDQEAQFMDWHRCRDDTVSG